MGEALSIETIPESFKSKSNQSLNNPDNPVPVKLGMINPDNPVPVKLIAPYLKMARFKPSKYSTSTTRSMLPEWNGEITAPRL